MDLGHQERAWTGDPQLNDSWVVGVEGPVASLLSVDEGALEPFGSASSALAVRSQASAALSRASEGSRNHDVYVDAIGAEPTTGMLARDEALCPEEIGQ